jgi:copper chaperone
MLVGLTVTTRGTSAKEAAMERWTDGRSPGELAEGGCAMVTETISVPEIHCDHCKTSIEGALASIGGVQEATVDIPARTVTVAYDDASVDHGDLVAAIEEQGYEVPAR